MSYLCVGDAEEGKLQQEVKHKATHACRGNALALWDVIGDVGEAGPDGSEQDSHALAACRGLHPKPNDGEDAAGDNDEVAEVVSKRHAREHGEGRVKSGTHPAVDGDDKTHDGVAEHTGADGILPVEADGDDGRSDLPVRHGPGVGHPVGHICAPVPRALGRRNRVEIGIGGSRADGEAARFLTHLQTEAREASLERGHATDFNGLHAGGDEVLLVGGRGLALIRGAIVEFFCGHDGDNGVKARSICPRVVDIEEFLSDPCRRKSLFLYTASACFFVSSLIEIKLRLIR